MPAGRTIVNAGADLFAGARDANLDAIGDAHQQIAASAASLGQTFAGDANDFIATNAARNHHAQHRAGEVANHLRAALRGALGFDFQVAAQIGTARFEAEIGSRLDLHRNETAPERFGARQLEASAGRKTLCRSMGGIQT